MWLEIPILFVVICLFFWLFIFYNLDCCFLSLSLKRRLVGCLVINNGALLEGKIYCAVQPFPATMPSDRG